MPRIAFVSGLKGHVWGGSEELWSRAARILHGDNHTLWVYVNRASRRAETISSMIASGIPVVEGTPKQKTQMDRVQDFWHYRLQNRIRGGSRVPPVNSRAKKQLLAFQPDLVCISNGAIGCALDWMEFCRTNRIPYVVICQANSESLWPADTISQRLADCYQSAEIACFVSNRNRQLFELQVGFRLNNARVVWNPINVSFDCQTAPLLPADPCVLACVGRLEPMAKGQDLLLQVLATSPWRGRSIRVDFYGRGPMQHSLQRTAAMLGVAERVRFVGHVDDVESIWHQSHALILPSRYEGLPLAVVEAMICGRVPIVTDVAGNLEVVEDNVTGFVAEAPTVRHLSEAMERAWQRREQWMKMGSDAARAIRMKIAECPESDFAELLSDLASRCVHRAVDDSASSVTV